MLLLEGLQPRVGGPCSFLCQSPGIGIAHVLQEVGIVTGVIFVYFPMVEFQSLDAVAEFGVFGQEE